MSHDTTTTQETDDSIAQATLEAFETENFGTDHLPYDVPYSGDNEDAARSGHREFYWYIFDRESYECPDCGRGIGEIERFEVHHLDRNPRNGRLWNLVAVCKRCHRWRHGNQTFSGWSLEEWKQGFLDEEFDPTG